MRLASGRVFCALAFIVAMLHSADAIPVPVVELEDVAFVQEEAAPMGSLIGPDLMPAKIKKDSAEYKEVLAGIPASILALAAKKPIKPIHVMPAARVHQLGEGKPAASKPSTASKAKAVKPAATKPAPHAAKPAPVKPAAHTVKPAAAHDKDAWLKDPKLLALANAPKKV